MSPMRVPSVGLTCLTATTRPAAALLLLLAFWPAAAPAGLVTIDRVVGANDLTLDRQVIQDLSPLPGHTFGDTLSATATAVTLSAGDTLQFRLVLQEPLRFAVSPTVAGVNAFFGGPGGVDLRLSLQSSGSSTAIQQTTFAGPTVSLISP